MGQVAGSFEKSGLNRTLDMLTHPATGQASKPMTYPCNVSQASPTLLFYPELQLKNL